MAGQTDEESRKQRLNLIYAAVALVAVLLVQYATRLAEIPYSKFEHDVEQGRVKSVRIGSETIPGTLTEPVDGKPRFTTQRVEGGILQRLRDRGVAYNGRPENTFVQQLLSWLIPIGILAAIWYVVFRRMIERQAGGGLPMPRERGPTYAGAKAKEIDTTVRARVDEAFERTLTHIREHRNNLHRAAPRLLDEETTEERHLRAFFELPEPAERQEAAAAQ